MNPKTRTVLGQFVKRAALLNEASYLSALKDMTVVLWPPQFDGPTREQLEVFVTRLRFFIQNNEPTSLQMVSKLLSDDLGIRRELLAEVEDVRKVLNDAAQTHPPIRRTSADDPIPPTWGEIMDTFIYGDIAHSTKSRRFEVWSRHEASLVLFNVQLSRILSVYAVAIGHLGEVFAAELSQPEQHSRDTLVLVS